MKSKLSLYLLLMIIVVFIGSIFYFSSKQVVRNISVSPTVIPKVIPSVIISNSAKCKAMQVDSLDPQAFLPDPACTPGVIDSSVTQDNLETTICRSGYTQTVRPPASYTNKLKKQQIADYGFQDTKMSDYEEDHFISLELGGSPADPKNLWPEPHPSFNEKDKVENYLHSQVCLGKLSLLQAQQEITKNWYEVYLQIK